ncbi:DEAD/DEAH box helicase family protein [Vitreoscilla massiliensis]|uniref:DEAD/DEAH box helicase family protein n=1 Tax=Vitreoscilla massiliensis TaxID=1689272 RepID=A0ABY4E5D7_9NEIS|nr:DEAD/DEAH box helicase family protein [Vitreoscilla massiliensis]UOO90090.1 DEAD/DEAH box helicase family protein [Vitreoscilla massiliensis]
MAGDSSKESVFQQDIIAQMTANGWQEGSPKLYNRETALYEADALAFVQQTQAKEWDKFAKLFPENTERHFLDALVAQLKKADTTATDEELRKCGTLGVLRDGFRCRNTQFEMCQFKPENSLNPDLLARYQANICRIVPELVYSPYATQAELLATGKQAKKWRIDLVLFVNGLPVATLELKSEFKQAVEQAKTQYKDTRLPKDPATNKPEPLLTFKRGALVHFAVSQYEVYMATQLAGKDTYFLPFNRGTHDGGAGNDVPEDINRYATEYLWNEILRPDVLLNILGYFVHLHIEAREDAEGRKYKKEVMIFPRYHQWDVVTKLVQAAKDEGTGQKYLIQHSAGSGKSNSIAWTAHQLSKLYRNQDEKQFHSVIVVTDRTVLDDQLQDTISQFNKVDGVVVRINHKEGTGAKSEKLGKALEASQAIIIVTIQTFPHVLDAIESNISLKQRRYAIIADEAHSSQSGSTARQLREVLMTETAEDEQTEASTDEKLSDIIAARKGSSNLSYYAFTATPKDKTLQLFGRVPNPNMPPSKTNLPVAYHVYSMRQAIEEGFILDVLKNYTNYKVVYKLKQKLEERDDEVDSKRAKVKLNQWVRLHDHNIAQKVKVIVEHFKEHVMHLLSGQAKAMVVTGSRKEAVRYKLAFDQYIAEKKYPRITAMVAFSGEVSFTDDDPQSTGLLDQKFNELNMNPLLNKREMRKAFDSDDFQVMIVANKFQTGFDQPKLCAMYVDKKLGGVECVQTLSRLNRTYPGKAAAGTFVLDFFNEPDEILNAFQPYYQTAELADVSNPDLVFDLFEKLKVAKIFQWNEVEQFAEAFFTKGKSSAAISNICKPAVERWTKRYQEAVAAYKISKEMFVRTQKTGDAVLIANAENALKEVAKEKERLELFKKDLGSFVRFYEFMSQIVDYDNHDLEKLSLYGRYLRPMLREQISPEDELDLSNVEMSHYRLSELKKKDLKLKANSTEHKLEPGNDLGSGKARDAKQEFLSVVIQRLNEVFVTDNLTEGDMVNYAITIRDKLSENQIVMTQIANNSPEQAMLGDFWNSAEDAIFESDEAHQNQKMQLLTDPAKMDQFVRILFDMLKQQ